MYLVFTGYFLSRAFGRWAIADPAGVVEDSLGLGLRCRSAHRLRRVAGFRFDPVRPGKRLPSGALENLMQLLGPLPVS